MIRLALCCVVLAACAGRAKHSSTYELCRDPQFQCVPAPTKALQVDTNLSLPSPNHLRG